MSILTLTTDLGYRDPYLAIVKAKLLGLNPGLSIIDLSCDIRDHNMADAAYILGNSLPYFPEGTIHLVSVKFLMDASGNKKEHAADNTRYLLTRYKGQYIICPDNGLFTLLDKSFNETVYQLYYEDNSKHHFFLKDVFVDAATHLLQQKQPEEIGMPVTDYYQAYQFESFLSGNVMRGKGIYVDDFGNIVTNITRDQFYEVAGNRSFMITLPGARIDKISNTYDEVRMGRPLILFNSFGYLEVAINGGSAYKMLCPKDIGVKFEFNLMIEFQ